MSAKMVSKIVEMKTAFDLAELCIKESAFVQITPLPDDLYEVSVKQDSKSLLRTSYCVFLHEGVTVSDGSVTAINLVVAAELVRGEATPHRGRVCFAGSYEVVTSPRAKSATNEYVDMDEDSGTGFIISVVSELNGLTTYRADEWLNGNIVDSRTGVYQVVRRWISQQHPAHWGRRYDLQALCGLWQVFLETPLDDAGERLAEGFLFFPIGARVRDVAGLFEEANSSFACAKKEMFGA